MEYITLFDGVSQKPKFVLSNHYADLLLSAEIKALLLNGGIFTVVRDTAFSFDEMFAVAINKNDYYKLVDPSDYSEHGNWFQHMAPLTGY